MQVLRYVKKAPGRGLLFRKGTSMGIIAYSDVDYAGCVGDRKSTTGFCTFVAGNLVT